MPRATSIAAVAAAAALLGAVAYFVWVAWPADHHVPVVDEVTPRPPAASGRELVDTWGGYRLTYPDDWKLADHRSGTQMIRADLTHGKSGCQVRVMKAGDDFLDGYLGRFKADMESHWGGSVQTESRVCGELGKAQGCRVAMTHQRKDGTAYWLGQYVWVRAGRAVVIQAGAPIDSKTRDKPALDAVAGTFAWLDVGQ